MIRKTLISLIVDEDPARPHNQNARLLLGADGIAGPTVPTAIFGRTPYDVLVKFVEALAKATPKEESSPVDKV